APCSSGTATNSYRQCGITRTKSLRQFSLSRTPESVTITSMRTLRSIAADHKTFQASGEFILWNLAKRGAEPGSDLKFGGHSYNIVSFLLREAVVLCQPAQHFTNRFPETAFEGAGRGSESFDGVSMFDAWPGDAVALEQINGELNIHRRFGTLAEEFAVA